MLAAFGKIRIVSNIDRLEIRELGRLKAAVQCGPVSVTSTTKPTKRSPVQIVVI